MNFLGLSLAANKHDVFHFRVLNNSFMNFSMFSYLIPHSSLLCVYMARMEFKNHLQMVALSSAQPR